MPDWVPGVIALAIFVGFLLLPPVDRFFKRYMDEKRSDDYYADRRYW